MAAATKVAVGSTWTFIAADVTALNLLQCIASGAAVVELQTASSAPAESTEGVRLANMDTFRSGTIGDLGTGALYARRNFGNNVNLLVRGLGDAGVVTETGNFFVDGDEFMVTDGASHVSFEVV